MGVERKVYKVLVRKPEGKSPLGRPRSRWEVGIRMTLGKTGRGCGVDSVGSRCGMHGSGEKSVQGFGEKARRKETTWKTEE
jgi:hypothetical protein